MTSAAGVDASAADSHQPPKVGRRHVVPRRPQHVGTNEEPLIEGSVHHFGHRRASQALSHRPPGIWVVLSLHRRQVAHHLCRRCHSQPPKEQTAQATLDDPVLKVTT